ncbi:hypothetical protein DFJ77DRAFT_452385 [Powellomyces hirtus]|nr:hypothetical protein DFJ77DRAFT_452385 [Powellomyces hirtus]
MAPDVLHDQQQQNNRQSLSQTSYSQPQSQLPPHRLVKKPSFTTAMPPCAAATTASAPPPGQLPPVTPPRRPPPRPTKTVPSKNQPPRKLISDTSPASSSSSPSETAAARTAATVQQPQFLEIETICLDTPSPGASKKKHVIPAIIIETPPDQRNYEDGEDAEECVLVGSPSPAPRVLRPPIRPVAAPQQNQPASAPAPQAPLMPQLDFGLLANPQLLMPSMTTIYAQQLFTAYQALGMPMIPMFPMPFMNVPNNVTTTNSAGQNSSQAKQQPRQRQKQHQQTQKQRYMPPPTNVPPMRPDAATTTTQKRPLEDNSNAIKSHNKRFRIAGPNAAAASVTGTALAAAPPPTPPPLQLAANNNGSSNIPRRPKKARSTNTTTYRTPHKNQTPTRKRKPGIRPPSICIDLRSPESNNEDKENVPPSRPHSPPRSETADYDTLLEFITSPLERFVEDPFADPTMSTYNTAGNDSAWDTLFGDMTTPAHTSPLLDWDLLGPVTTTANPTSTIGFSSPEEQIELLDDDNNPVDLNTIGAFELEYTWAEPTVTTTTTKGTNATSKITTTVPACHDDDIDGASGDREARETENARALSLEMLMTDFPFDDLLDSTLSSSIGPHDQHQPLHLVPQQQPSEATDLLDMTQEDLDSLLDVYFPINGATAAGVGVNTGQYNNNNPIIPSPLPGPASKWNEDDFVTTPVVMMPPTSPVLPPIDRHLDHKDHAATAANIAADTQTTSAAASSVMRGEVTVNANQESERDATCRAATLEEAVAVAAAEIATIVAGSITATDDSGTAMPTEHANPDADKETEGGPDLAHEQDGKSHPKENPASDPPTISTGVEQEEENPTANSPFTTQKLSTDFETARPASPQPQTAFTLLMP